LPARIIGTGSYLPEKRLTNAELEQRVDTSDEWITTRTGIRERRVAAPEQAASDLALEAARRALEAADTAPEEIDLIMVATISGDMSFPSTACLLQHALGARPVPSFDLLAACSGFLYGLETARHFISGGAAGKVLVVGSEVLSRITDYEDRTTCILFGDGAGAAVVAGSDDPESGILDIVLGADAEHAELLSLPGGGSRNPASPEMIEQRLQFMKMSGREVFKHAVSTIVEVVGQNLRRTGLTCDDVSYIIPHQMNRRIMESSAKRLGFPIDKVVINIDNYGNTSAASIPIALDEAVRDGRIQRGDLLAMVAFGGGFTWGSALVRW
jgi:3-oxoacyl-[acyl-carrier-protein] synthase III